MFIFQQSIGLFPALQSMLVTLLCVLAVLRVPTAFDRWTSRRIQLGLLTCFDFHCQGFTTALLEDLRGTLSRTAILFTFPERPFGSAIRMLCQ